MNYFQLFDIDQNLIIDERYLQDKFYQLCRKYHPDSKSRVGNNDEISIIEINLAYMVLKDKQLRLEYILKINNIISLENEKQTISDDFLADMYDLNEKIFNYKANTENIDLFNEIYAEIENYIKLEESKIERLLELKNHSFSKSELLDLKEYYLKNKYFDRLKSSL